MRDSNAGGTLRATERLRHPHDNKPRAAAGPTRAALAKGARTLGAVLATGAGTLALGLTAVKLGSAAKGLYERHQSKRASEARSRELRVIVPNKDPQRAGTLEWTPEKGKIMVCVPGECYIVESAAPMAWVTKTAGSSVRTLTYKKGLKKATKVIDEAARPVCAAMAHVLADRAAALDPKHRDRKNLTANALSDENGKWLESPATCEFHPREGRLECTMVRGDESDKQHIPFESLDEQRKALDEGKHPEKATEHADGALAPYIGTVWKPEIGKIMVCVPSKYIVVASAEAVAWVEEFAGSSVKTSTYTLGMRDWNLQRDTNEAVRPVCAAMARALAYAARLDPELDSTNLRAKALSDENGTWLETHATCELISGKRLRCTLKRGNEWNVQIIPFASILATIDAARVPAAFFGHGLWHKTRGLALPAHSVVMYTE
jgi:hypothetical protein